MNNLWPSLSSSNPGDSNTPKSILIHQAKELERASDTKFSGIVVTTTIKARFDKKFEGSDVFQHEFSVVIPDLDYSFTLLTLSHKIIEIYPCHVESDIVFVATIVKNESELLDLLKTIFNDKETVRILKSIMFQLNAEEDAKDF
ncbi:hypothetical protein [Lewinella sp. LCG006]|uniref:hypothetical protein n=1 Tax=Lewinella sp. LCG006 TaxID=3231911 RepID=UPI00345F3E93